MNQTDPTAESARALLWRHGLPEDVIDGALCLHAQELAALQRAAISKTDDPVFYEGEAGWLVSLIEPDQPAAASAVVSPPTNRAALRDRIAEALMRWAEGNNSPKYASMRRPETVRQNASGRADAVLAELKPELDAIARVRDACEQLRRSAVLADGQPHTDRERGIVQAVTRIMAALDGPAPVAQQPAAEAWVCKCPAGLCGCGHHAPAEQQPAAADGEETRS